MHKVIQKVTQDIITRSRDERAIYKKRIEEAKKTLPKRDSFASSNLAHAVAPLSTQAKEIFVNSGKNIAIVTAYNDMLSAHEPYGIYPPLIKRTLLELGATAQVAGGVPAMCDGVTQSQLGMQLSLFSRDTIALASSIALSHNVYDGTLFLGICDKIVPGMVMAALAFGHLPAVFVPAGPMQSGISNKKKSLVRQDYVQGKVTKLELFKTEAASYHSSGTCTFFGTANSNQMLLEMLGLQLANSSFVNANTPLRDALTQEAAKQILTTKAIADIVDERSFVNAIVGLMATGGSTNHTIHLIAMAKACGITLTWDDFDAISSVTPLLCRLYPNGEADVNHFRDAGAMSSVIAQLLKAELLHADIETIQGTGYAIVEPVYENKKLQFKEVDGASKNLDVIASIKQPFAAQGGLQLLEGNMGRSVIKTSALKPTHRYIQAPAKVFDSQEALQEAFKANELNQDFIAVVRFQGPKANGMPELHGLLPAMGTLQDKGYKVAIVTDGRMSGASGKVPSCIHLSQEALDGGILAKVMQGDMIQLDIEKGSLNLLVDDAVLEKRTPSLPSLTPNRHGIGREFFTLFRGKVSSAEEGATVFDPIGEEHA